MRSGWFAHLACCSCIAHAISSTLDKHLALAHSCGGGAAAGEEGVHQQCWRSSSGGGGSPAAGEEGVHQQRAADRHLASTTQLWRRSSSEGGGEEEEEEVWSSSSSGAGGFAAAAGCASAGGRHVALPHSAHATRSNALDVSLASYASTIL